MASVRLSDKKTRRIAAATGLDVIRAWGSGDPAWFEFVTRDHRHGSYNAKSGKWEPSAALFHYTSCDDIDPTQPSGYRESTRG